jgi:hypothetical protein
MPRLSATEKERRRPPEAHLDWGMKTPGGRFCFNSITSDAFAFSLTEFLVILHHPEENRYRSETGTVYLADTNVLYVA